MGRVTLDHRAIRGLLQTAPRRLVDDAADRIRGHIDAATEAVDPDISPTVQRYTTDRAAASVTVANGRNLQARDGIFTKAAAAIGLEVKQR